MITKIIKWVKKKIKEDKEDTLRREKEWSDACNFLRRLGIEPDTKKRYAKHVR